MLRSSTLGQTGRYKNYGSLGQPLSALSGFYHLTGWADKEPLALPVAYSDWVASRFGAAALLACLNKRKRTGEGAFIDISQFEASLQFILPAILQYSASKIIMERNGNANDCISAHAVYKCKGTDRWCAITFNSDSEWIDFCKAAGHPDWIGDDRFSTIEKRKKNEKLLNQLIEDWTVDYSSEEVMHIMQTAGICAGAVQNSRDIYLDKQLKSRQAFWNAEHPVLGSFSYLGQPAILSKTPAKYKMPAPSMGAHNEYVCTNILGLSTEEFIQLLEEEAFS
jgi:crotonobetainyl-CoA:carnitine CoA-transferase CaiB-like acyl-CoA transferase